jgi:hypothetical protein
LFLVVLLAGLNFGFAHILANTYHRNDIISNIELPRDAQELRPDKQISTKVYLTIL